MSLFKPETLLFSNLHIDLSKQSLVVIKDEEAFYLYNNSIRYPFFSFCMHEFGYV